MKKSVCVLLAVMMAAALFILPFSAVSGLFEYDTVDGHVEIRRYIGSVRNVTVPDTIGGLPVTVIRRYAFDNTRVAQVTIPASVTVIAEGAFDRCASLASVQVNASNKNYRSTDGVLYSADGKTLLRCPQTKSGSFTVPSGTSAIAPYAFEDCTALSSVTLSEGVVTLGDYAFASCTALSSVTLPATLQSIGNGAFYEDTALAGLMIPQNVSHIGDYAFYHTTSLAYISVIGLNQSFSSVDGVLFDRNVTRLIACPILKSGAYSVPSTVTEIGMMAFSGCAHLTSVLLPSGLKTIGAGAMTDCSSLTGANIPDSVTEISEFAFDGCTSLESVSLPKRLGAVSYGAFNNCASLKRVSIPDTVTDIGNYAFYGCKKLTEVRLTDGSRVTRIGRFSFQNCTSLASFAIPNTVTEIGQYAFSGCTALKNIYIPSSVKTLGISSFAGCTALAYMVVTPSTTEFGYPLMPETTTFYIKSTSSPVYSFAVSHAFTYRIVGDLSSYAPKFPAAGTVSVSSSPTVRYAAYTEYAEVDYELLFDYIAGVVRYLPPEILLEADTDRDGMLTINDVINMRSEENEP